MSPKYLLLFFGCLVLITTTGCDHLVNQPNNESTTIPEKGETPIPSQDNLDDSWVRVYGNGQESSGAGVVQTEDGGYLIVGGTSPEQESNSVGGVMLLKTDSAGKKVWQKTYGGEGYDAGWVISQAHGGGYILGGTTTSYGAGGRDAYLIKVDEEGNEIWSRTYGGTLDESISVVKQTEDGGYFLVGNCVDPKDFVADPGSAGYGGFEGRSNMYAVKTDGEGNETWSKTLESEFNILTVAGEESPQGGYYILGTKVYFPKKGDDLLLVMLDEEGQEVWSRAWEEDTIGGYTMIQDSDGNLIITGYIRHTDGNDTDIFLLKVDPLGIEIWQKKYGEDEFYEIGRDVIETKNGDYIIFVDRLISFFASDDTNLLLGLNREGEVLWISELENKFVLKGGILIQNVDGDYVITGAKIDSKGWFSTILIKVDKDVLVSK